ncbi:MAG: hypothetical protein EOM47_09400 [Bacteroidia bacterium]|nr:hypothetical protein [Bacteroidia bacterium]
MKKIDYFTFIQCETLANLDKEFRFTDGIKINSEFYPMPKFGKDKILQLAPHETDRPIKQFDFNSYAKGFDVGYSRPLILTNEKHLLNAAKCDLPTYFVSDGIAEKQQCYDFGFSVGKCYQSWEYICDNINEYKTLMDINRKFNSLDEAYDYLDRWKLFDGHKNTGTTTFAKSANMEAIRFDFDTWLQENKGLHDTEKYNEFLNLNVFLEFIKYLNDKKQIHSKNYNDYLKQLHERAGILKHEPQPEPMAVLSEHGLPRILAKYDTKKLYDKLVNIAFTGSELCFNSLLVNGKPFNTSKLHWKYERKKGIVCKAQLKMFINTITGNAENTKEAYFKQVFGIEMKKSDYKNAKLNNDLSELLKECEKNN